jgi:uncharacterized protein (UPF0218 family)
VDRDIALEDVTAGTVITRGDIVGEVVEVAGIPADLHFANRRARRRDQPRHFAFRWLLEIANTSAAGTLTFPVPAGLRYLMLRTNMS